MSLQESIYMNRLNFGIINFLKNIKHLKNPENVTVIDEKLSLYSHTNSRGITHYYKLFGDYPTYMKSKYYNNEGYKMNMVCGYEIIEISHDDIKEEKKYA